MNISVTQREFEAILSQPHKSKATLRRQRMKIISKMQKGISIIFIPYAASIKTNVKSWVSLKKARSKAIK